MTTNQLPLTVNQSSISIKAIFSQSWHQLKGQKGHLWGAMAIMVLVGIGIGILVSAITFLGNVGILKIGGYPLAEANKILMSKTMLPDLHLALGITVFLICWQLLLRLFNLFVTAPLKAGYYVIALHAAKNEQFKIAMLFSPYKYIWRLFFGLVLIYLLALLSVLIFTFLPPQIFHWFGETVAVQRSADIFQSLPNLICFILFIVGLLLAIYILLRYFWFLPHVAYQHLKLCQAFKLSHQGFKRHKWRTIAIVILQFLILIICLLPFILTLGLAPMWLAAIGFVIAVFLLVWAWPWLVLIYGNLYHSVFHETA